MIARIYPLILCFFFLLSNLFAQDIYLPINKVPSYLPNKIIINMSKVTVDFNKFIANIKVDKEDNIYIANLPENDSISISSKKTALLVTYYHYKKDIKHHFIYRHKDIVLPEKPINYEISPSENDFFVSSLSFLRSYAFWDADQVNHAYDLLADYHRGIIKLFGYTLTDITHKLCLAKEPKSTLLSILDEQTITCNEVKKYFKNRSSKEMNHFNKNVIYERQKLLYIFECSQGLRSSQSCQNVSQKIRDIALNLKTIERVIK